MALIKIKINDEWVDIPVIRGKSAYESYAAYGGTLSENDFNVLLGNLDKTKDIYNITLTIPLPVGQYYTSVTARSSVPIPIRKRGLELIYETAAGVWYQERFIGLDIANWTTPANWELVPIKSQIEIVEEVTAQSIVELKARIDALQTIINNMILGTVQIDTLNIVKGFNLYGSSNLILTGTAAPAVVPDFIGQFFIKTSATTACYQATGNSSVNDWKQIG